MVRGGKSSRIFQNMSNMFYYSSSLKSVPLFDTSNVTNMSNMFYNCKNIKESPLLDTSNVKDMSAMFSGCSSLKSVPQLNTSKVTKMTNMFYNCTLLQTIPQLDVSKVTSMSSIFSNCFSIVSCLLKGLATSLEMHHASELEKSSVLFIFENAQTVATSKTIKLHADVFAQLTEDEIAIATEKGFSVVSA